MTRVENLFIQNSGGLTCASGLGLASPCLTGRNRFPLPGRGSPGIDRLVDRSPADTKSPEFDLTAVNAVQEAHYRVPHFGSSKVDHVVQRDISAEVPHATRGNSIRNFSSRAENVNVVRGRPSGTYQSRFTGVARCAHPSTLGGPCLAQKVIPVPVHTIGRSEFDSPASRSAIWKTTWSPHRLCSASPPPTGGDV